MAIKYILSALFVMTSVAVQAEYVVSAEEHVLAATERAECRLSVPSRLESLEAKEGVERFAVYPLRPKLAAEFCQNGEQVEVTTATASKLRIESAAYTDIMTLAAYAMAGEEQISRDELSRNDTFFHDKTYEVFNYQVSGYYQGDECQVQSDKALRVVGFLGPQGVLLRYENDLGSSENRECPNRTIILVRQSDLISRV